MKTIVPDYYKSFRCIADKCKHSCCIGWEIDVDNKACDYYLKLDGDFGNRLRKNIDFTAIAPHFILDNSLRCPFLNDNNLCDIIINLGEDNLCDICREHPRFYNFYTNRTELGIGMCCEAAAKLILTNNDKVELINLDNSDEMPTEEETAFFTLRQNIFKIIQNRSKSIRERVLFLIEKYDICFPDYSLSQWAEIFLELERLDDEWTHLLEKLKEENCKELIIPDTIAEQILVYFIYRHLGDGLYDNIFKERISFAVLSLYIITAVANCSDIGFIDAARLYSSEIEYSEENTNRLINCLVSYI